MSRLFLMLAQMRNRYLNSGPFSINAWCPQISDFRLFDVSSWGQLTAIAIGELTRTRRNRFHL